MGVPGQESDTVEFKKSVAQLEKGLISNAEKVLMEFGTDFSDQMLPYTCALEFMLMTYPVLFHNI